MKNMIREVSLCLFGFGGSLLCVVGIAALWMVILETITSLITTGWIGPYGYGLIGVAVLLVALGGIGIYFTKDATDT